jgi:hypothetical protein
MVDVTGAERDSVAAALAGTEGIISTPEQTIAAAKAEVAAAEIKYSSLNVEVAAETKP